MAAQFQTFVAGNVLTASEVNDYLMKQAVIACDSSSDYPGSPVEGMVVYDKALDALLSYTTATTTWNPPWNLPWGYVAQTKETSDRSSFTTGTNQMTTVDATLVDNRRYRVSATWYRFDSTVADDTAYLSLNDSTTVFAQMYTFVAGNNPGTGGTFFGTYDATADGTVTFQLTAARSGSSTGTWTMGAAATTPLTILVEDIGPAAAPA